MCFCFIFPINFVFLHNFFKRLQCAMLCMVVRKTKDLVMRHMSFWLKWPSIDKELEDFTHRIATQTHCNDFCHHLDHVQSHFRCTPSPNPPQDLIATCLTCLATVALRDPEQVTDNFFLLQQATSKGAFDMVFCCCHGYPLKRVCSLFSSVFFWHSCCTPSLVGTWHFWAQYDKPPKFLFGFPAVWWREEPFYVVCLIRPLRTVIPLGFKQGWLYLV